MRTSAIRIGMILLTGTLGASGVSTQQVRLKSVMQLKLQHAQRLLGDVVTSDWASLEADTAALQQTTRDPAWAVLTTPEYIQHTMTFTRAVEELGDAARRHDLEMAPLAYVSLTLSCVQCHRYVARMRIAATPDVAAGTSARSPTEKGAGLPRLPMRGRHD